MCPPECFVFLVTVSRVSSQVPFESLTSFRSSLPCKLELTPQSIEPVIVAGLFFASETFLFCFSSSLNNSLQLLFYFFGGFYSYGPCGPESGHKAYSN